MRNVEWMWWLWRTLLRRLGASWTERALGLCTVSLVVLGIWLRSRGMFGPRPIPLGIDESSWALQLIDRPVAELVMRPIGFMAITKALVLAFGPWEFAFRAVSWSAGIATVCMAPWLARRLLVSPAPRLLLVAIIALQPGVIDLAREFKPYVPGLALHMGLMLLCLRYAARSRLRDLLFFLAAALVALLFTQDIVFAYPGCFALCAIEAWRRRRLRHLVVLCVGAATAVACVLAMYWFFWRALDVGPDSGAAAFWGRKYHVFYTPGSDQSFLRWYLDHYEGLAGLPGRRRNIWESSSLSAGELEQLISVDHTLWFFLHVAGVLCVVFRRRYRAALLLFTPLVVMSVFNLFGVWPFGAFRANLFALTYVAPLAVFGLEGAASAPRRLWDIVPAIVLVLVPFVAFESSWHANKRVDTESTLVPAAMLALLRLAEEDPEASREVLLLDSRTCPTWSYYAYHHPQMKKLEPRFTQHFVARCSAGSPAALFKTARKSLRTQRQRAWFLIGAHNLMGYLGRPFPADLVRIADESFYLAGVREALVIGVRRAR